MANAPKHTPGPWTVEGSHPWHVTCPTSLSEAGMDDARGKVCDVGFRPNAHLIAAAPEMLDALMLAEEELLAAFGEPDGSSLEKRLGCVAIRRVRAAIAKATQP